MQTCIVIAELIGLLSSEPVNVYKIECSESKHQIIIHNDRMYEVDFIDEKNIMILNEQ